MTEAQMTKETKIDRAVSTLLTTSPPSEVANHQTFQFKAWIFSGIVT